MARMRLPSPARDELTLPEISDDAVLGGLPLVFQTLGAARLVLGDARIVPSTGTLFALLVRVAYSPEYRQSRDALLTSLWPGQTVARQRGNLRQALYKARSMGINVSLIGDAVCLDPRQVVTTFALSQTTALFDRDVIRGNEPFGVFLPGFVAPWPDLQEWIDTQRATVHAAVRRVLVEQLRTRRERADWTGAEALARWLLQFDPLHEEATLTLAECTMLAGSKAEAVAIIDRYLAEIGPSAGDIRLPATLLRKRFTEPPSKKRPSFAPTERHFVGRTSELANLTMAMRRARWHDGSAVMLVGPSGIGKTRLTRELCKVAVIEGVRIVQTTCRSNEISRNLGVPLDLVPEMLQEKGALGCSPESLRALKTVRQVESADVPRDETFEESDHVPIDAHSRQPLPTGSALRAGFIDLLFAISYERPTLLIIEDVQWLDDGSWDLLNDLVARLENARVFCVLTSKTESPRSTSKGYLPSRIGLVPLYPLAKDECVQLAHALASDFSTGLSAQLADWFATACDGGPLYLNALVSHWVETGEAGGIPPTLHTVLGQCLNQLSHDAIRVLQTVGLLGKIATPELIKEVLELETYRLLDAIEELACANALRETRTCIEVHHLLSKSALSRLSTTSMLALRRRIGAVLSVKLEELAAPIELVVGENFALCGDVDGLAKFALDAFALFLRNGEAHRAIDLYDACILHLQEHSSRHSLHALLQDALYLGGYYARLLQSQNYLENIGNADPIWDTSHPEEVIRMLEAADHSSNANDYEDLAARSLLIAESPIVAADIRLKAATFTIRSAGNSSVTWHAKRAFETATELMTLQNAEAFQRDLVELYYHTVFDDMDRAALAAHRLAKHADGLSDQNSRIKILSDAAWALRVTGAVDEARARFESIAVDARRLRMFTRAAIAATFRSSLAFEQDDDIVQANYWLEFGGALVRESDDSFLDFVYQGQRARLGILTGDIESAHLGVAALTTSTGGHAVGNSYVSTLRLGLARLEGNTELMRVLTLQLLESHRREKRQLGQDFRACQLFESLIALGDQSAAHKLLRQYIDELRRERTPPPVYLSRHCN